VSDVCKVVIFSSVPHGYKYENIFFHEFMTDQIQCPLKKSVIIIVGISCFSHSQIDQMTIMLPCELDACVNCYFLDMGFPYELQLDVMCFDQYHHQHHYEQ